MSPSPDETDPNAAILRLCPEAAAGQNDEVLARLTDPRGTVQLLTLTSEANAPQGCIQQTLPVRKADLRWAGFAPEGLPNSKGIVLSGRAEQPPTGLLSGFSAATPDGTSATTETPESSMAPLNRNLIALAKLRPFGREERVTAQMQDGTLEMQCQPGTSPAGLALELPDHYLPPIPSAAVRIHSSHSGTIRLALHDMAMNEERDPLPMGDLQQGQSLLHLPSLENRPKDAFALTLVCPQSAGTARLEALELVAMNGQEPATHWQHDESLSAWAWSPELWQREGSDLIARANTLDLATIYISVLFEDGQLQDQERLAEFIQQARSASLKVWAVEGDPAAVVESERPHFVARAHAIAAYNRNRPDSMQLSGVQYDIEPYLLEGYSQATVQWLVAYRTTVETLTEVLEVPVELALPFWFVGNAQTEKVFLNALPEKISSIAIMSYRTQPQELKSIATPFLDWGVENGIPIRVGLEAGPIADEMHWHFRPAVKGELWSLMLGDQEVLVLLDSGAENPLGQSWRYSHRVLSPGKRQSFQGNLEAMRSVMEETVQDFRSWPSFHGFALHGVL